MGKHGHNYDEREPLIHQNETSLDVPTQIPGSSERKMDPKNSPAHFEVSRTVKIFHSVTIYFSTFAYGCGYTFLSPAILALSRQFETDVSQISIVFTILTIAYLSSALVCGALFNLLNRQLLMVALLLFMTVPLYIIPFTSNIYTFFTLGGILGVGCGGYDVGQVAGIISIWRGKAALFILIQHFAYSIGTILPPLILSPFLPKDVNDQAKSQLVVPFAIAGSILAIAVVIHVALYFKLRQIHQSEVQGPSVPVSIQTSNPNSNDPAHPEKQLTPSQRLWSKLKQTRRTILLTFLSCAVIGPYRGMELTTMQFLPSFAVFSTLHLSEYEGTRLLFGLNSAYAVGRGLGILLVLKCPPELILVGNLILIFMSNSILLIGGQTSVEWMWVGSILFGLGLSTIFPAYYSYIEKYFCVSHTVVSFITVSDGILASLYPLIVASKVETFPAILTWINFFSMGVLFMAFAVTYWLTKIKKM